MQVADKLEQAGTPNARFRICRTHGTGNAGLGSMRNARASANSRGRRSAGFTLVELILVVLFMAVVIALLLPAVLTRRTSCRINCTNNLKQLGLAYKTWSIDNSDRFPMQVSTNEGGTLELVKGPYAFAHFAVMSNELSTPRVLLCPQENKRTWATNFTSDLANSKISYFVGVGATETNAASLLGGDRDLTNGMGIVHGALQLFTNWPAGWTGELHGRGPSNQKGCFGNVLLSDGSVFAIDSRGLNDKVKAGGTNPRLAMP